MKTRAIFVAGHRGLVGSAIVRRLQSRRLREPAAAHAAPSSICATRPRSTRSSPSERPEYVFLAAAKVGGIHANDTLSGRFHPRQPADPDQRHRRGVPPRRAASCCSWARAASIRSSRRSRCRRDCLLTGPLEPTNEWYAIAKIAGLKMCQAYRRQYGFNAICGDADQSVRPGRQLRSAELARAAGADPQVSRGEAARRCPR